MSDPAPPQESDPRQPGPDPAWALGDPRKEQAEGRNLRTFLVIAALVHLALLATTVPNIYTQETAPEEKDPPAIVVYPLPPRPPTPPKTEIPKKATERVPWPEVLAAPPDVIIEDSPPDLVDNLALSFHDMPIVAPPSPPPLAAPEPEVSGPLQAGSQIERPERIHMVQPRFTPTARRAGIQGTVILDAIIDREGRVRDVRVRKGLPLGLDEEALRAVRQWRYEPSTLDGRPVEVALTVTVRFGIR